MLCKVRTLDCWTEQNFYRRLCERKSKRHKFQDIFKVNIKHDKEKNLLPEWKRIGKHRKKRDLSQENVLETLEISW